MSDQCQMCGPNKSEAPIIICAPCALSDLGCEKEAALAIGKNATGPAIATPSCIECGAPLLRCGCQPDCPGGRCSRGCG